MHSDLSFSPLVFASLLFKANLQGLLRQSFFFFAFLFLGDGLDPFLLYHVMNLRPQFIRHSVYQIQSLKSISHFYCIIIRDLIQVIPEWSSGFPYFLQFKSELTNSPLKTTNGCPLQLEINSNSTPWSINHATNWPWILFPCHSLSSRHTGSSPDSSARPSISQLNDFLLAAFSHSQTFPSEHQMKVIQVTTQISPPQRDFFNLSSQCLNTLPIPPPITFCNISLIF